MNHKKLFIVHFILTGITAGLLAFNESVPLIVLAMSALFSGLGVVLWIRFNVWIYWINFIFSIFTIYSLSYFQIQYQSILFDIMFKYLTTLGLVLHLLGLIWASGDLLDISFRKRPSQSAYELHLLASLLLLILVSHTQFERFTLVGIGVFGFSCLLLRIPFVRIAFEGLFSVLVFSKFMNVCVYGEISDFFFISTAFFLVYFFSSFFLHGARALIGLRSASIKRLGP